MLKQDITKDTSDQHRSIRCWLDKHLNNVNLRLFVLVFFSKHTSHKFLKCYKSGCIFQFHLSNCTSCVFY